MTKGMTDEAAAVSHERLPAELHGGALPLGPSSPRKAVLPFPDTNRKVRPKRTRRAHVRPLEEVNVEMSCRRHHRSLVLERIHRSWNRSPVPFSRERTRASPKKAFRPPGSSGRTWRRSRVVQKKRYVSILEALRKISRPCVVSAASVSRRESAPYCSMMSTGRSRFPGLAHFLPLFVPDERVDVHVPEGNVIHELQSHHDHARHPEEDDVESGDEKGCGIITSQFLRRSGQPKVEKGQSALLNHVSSTSSS